MIATIHYVYQMGRVSISCRSRDPLYDVYPGKTSSEPNGNSCRRVKRARRVINHRFHRWVSVVFVSRENVVSPSGLSDPHGGGADEEEKNVVSPPIQSETRFEHRWTEIKKCFIHEPRGDVVGRVAW